MMDFLLKLLNINPDPDSSVNIVFKSIFPLWIVFLVVIPFIILYSFIIYKRERIESKKSITAVLSFLRIGAIILAFLFLWEPVIIVKDFYLRKAKFVFLIDDSKSMSLTDRYDINYRQNIASAANITKRNGFLDLEKVDKMSRLDIIKNTLYKFIPVLDEYKKYYDFSFYTFSKETMAISDIKNLNDIKPVGDYTAIGEAIKSVLYEQRGSLLAGIAIISDGVNNAGENPISVLDKVGFASSVPIFTFGVGNPDKPKDIALVDLIAPEEVPLNDTIDFNFTVKHSGFDGKTITCSLELDNKTIQEKQITLPTEKESVEDVIKYKAEKEGDYKFVVNCAPFPEETDYKNNKMEASVKVRSMQIKLLYIEKWPRFEYRALKDLIIRDPKYFKAQFFLIEADFVQDHTPNTEPLKEIPSSKKELFDYDVILIGDVEPKDLPSVEAGSNFIENIYKFVDDIGGGVAFIAGNNMPSSFKNITSKNTIKDLFPFNFTGEEIMLGITEDSSDDIKVEFKLEREGKISDIFKIGKEEREDLFGLKGGKNILSGFYSFVPIKRVKHGVEVLASFIDPLQRVGQKEFPFVIAWKWGIQAGGRILFIATDELWRWREYVGSKYHGEFWIQAIKYLKGGYKRKGSKRFSISTDKTEYGLGEDVKISVKARDNDFNPLTLEELTLTLLDMENRMEELKAKKTNTPGNYTYVYTPNKEGKYTLSVKTDIQEPQEGSESKIGFEVKSTTPEFLTLIMDKQMLKNIAVKSNGNFYYVWQIDELKKQFDNPPTEAAQISKVTEHELWSNKFLFFLFLIIISAEWVLRKLVQLL